MKILINEKQYKTLTEGLKKEWEEVDGKLVRTYEFPSYDETMEFVNKVAEIAKEQNHHPEMIVTFDKVKIIMFDHEENRISDKCHKFTKAVDDMVDDQQELDERSRSFAFTRKKRLFSKPEIMSNPNRYKLRDKVLKGLS